jgi:hypothetical protein
MNLAERLSSFNSRLEARLAAEYGAVFVTTAVPPPKVVFADEADALAFQSSLDTLKLAFGPYEIELQAEAMKALQAARSEAADIGVRISPRSADSGRRSYQDTVALWLRNVSCGLEHWLAQSVLSTVEAESIRNLPMHTQVEAVLDLEDSRQIFFSTHFDKSILYSVAAPGASQHLSMLAFDVAEFGDEAAQSAMASHGWYRTVLSDLPHFTYLGHKQELLPDLGLELIVRKSDACAYHFWIPRKDH